MLVKQVSIFVENKDGSIADVLGILGNYNINIFALSIADTTNFGVLRLVVDDPLKAKEVLTSTERIVKVNDCISISISDDPGSLGKVLKYLSNEKIGIEYLYTYIKKEENNAMIVLKTSDMTKAIECLNNNNVKIIQANDIGQKRD